MCGCAGSMASAPSSTRYRPTTRPPIQSRQRVTSCATWQKCNCKMEERFVRFAYADPPYLGCGALYAKHHPDAHDWNDPDEHRRLVERLCEEYPDGWAMSLS